MGMIHSVLSGVDFVFIFLPLLKGVKLFAEGSQDYNNLVTTPHLTTT